MDSDAREPLPEIDNTKPHAARVYDYLAGGTNNFAADREAVQWATSSYPGGLEGAKAGVRANYVAITHLTNDLDVDMTEAARRINETPSGPMVLRTQDEMTGFFTGLDILDPGIVSVDEWRYTPGERAIAHYGAVGHKPQ